MYMTAFLALFQLKVEKKAPNSSVKKEKKASISSEKNKTVRIRLWLLFLYLLASSKKIIKRILYIRMQ